MIKSWKDDALAYALKGQGDKARRIAPGMIAHRFNSPERARGKPNFACPPHHQTTVPSGRTAPLRTMIILSRME